MQEIEEPASKDERIFLPGSQTSIRFRAAGHGAGVNLERSAVVGISAPLPAQDFILVVAKDVGKSVV